MSPPRLHVDAGLAPGATVDLPPAAARHVQVLRLQPGAAVQLFDGRGGAVLASVSSIGRREVQVRIDAVVDEPSRELPLAVTLAVGVPANDRMDALIEKACELGAAALVPLICERSVLRLDGERAAKRLAHWRAVAVAACEQCGRNHLPLVAPVSTLPAWLRSLPPADDGASARWRLDPRAPLPLPRAWDRQPPDAPQAVFLSGPEGGLSASEAAFADAAGFVAVGLGARVLRADTAPLAALAWLATHLAG